MVFGKKIKEITQHTNLSLNVVSDADDHHPDVGDTQLRLHRLRGAVAARAVVVAVRERDDPVAARVAVVGVGQLRQADLDRAVERCNAAQHIAESLGIVMSQ